MTIEQTEHFSKHHPNLGGIVYKKELHILIFSGSCDNLKMPNQLNTIKGVFCPRGYYRDVVPFLRSYYEFDKNANSISMNAEMLFVLNWFGDYRSLRFLCGYFGSRTFYFWGE